MKELEADIVVIGGGGAGLAAARAAAEKGARVIVVEKRGLGGSSAMAFGIFAAESPVQKRLNIKSSRDDFFRQAMDFAHWRINPRIVRAIIDKSGDTIRWLEEKGLEFDCLPYFHYPDQKIPTWHVPSGGGLELTKSLAQASRELGAQLLVHTPVKQISRSTKGRLKVLAEKSGEEFTIKTRSVIIATGGFGANKELLKKYCPEYQDTMVCFGVPNTGDGLRMAAGLGAASEGLGILMLSGPLTLGFLTITIGNPPDTKQLTINTGIVTRPDTVWVNRMGKRFIDESIGHDHHLSSHAVARQPKAFSYCIFDSRLAETIAEQGRSTPPRGLRNFRGGPRHLSRAESKTHEDPIKISESWDEIANWMGAEPEVLKATIDEYNAACDKGYDSIFGKDGKYLVPVRTPPYYTVRWYPSFPNTIGGIKVSENMGVLDQQFNPIPGVYAAGVDTGGWTAETYFILLTGWAFGYAVNSGRIAGENAADYVKSLIDL